MTNFAKFLKEKGLCIGSSGISCDMRWLRCSRRWRWRSGRWGTARMYSKEQQKESSQLIKREIVTDVDPDALFRGNEQNPPLLPQNKDLFQSVRRFQLDHLHSKDDAEKVLFVFPTFVTMISVVFVVETVHWDDIEYSAGVVEKLLAAVALAATVLQPLMELSQPIFPANISKILSRRIDREKKTCIGGRPLRVAASF